MGVGMRYGFAAMSTENGHSSTYDDASWALNAIEKQIDWGYRAMHGSIVLAKDIITAFYGTPIKYSYYSGCSTGGRQGLKQIQMFPDHFDGVLAGAPAWWTTHLQTWTVKLGSYNLPVDSRHHIYPSLFPTIGAEVLRQCDGIDGLVDNIITNPRQCDFHPEVLLCSPSRSTKCLTPPQLDTLYNIYSDYVDINQTFVFPHLELGSEAKWAILISGSAPNPLGTAYIQNFLLNDTDWDWRDFSYATVQLADALNPGNANADNFDLAPFHARGGKLLMYHGLGDSLIPPGASTYFYNHVLRTLLPRGIGLDSWYRLFLVPGMQHCVGSATPDAPWYFAGANQASILGSALYSTPGFEDPEHDVLLALMRWVEEGVPPDMFVATKWVDDSVEMGVGRQRIVCPWPEQAEYKGGDPDVAGSFECG